MKKKAKENLDKVLKKMLKVLMVKAKELVLQLYLDMNLDKVVQITKKKELEEENLDKLKYEVKYIRHFNGHVR